MAITKREQEIKERSKGRVIVSKAVNGTQFKLDNLGGNHKILSASETETSKQNIEKNLLAHMKLYHLYVIVEDHTVTPVLRYKLFANGSRKVLKPKKEKVK